MGRFSLLVPLFFKRAGKLLTRYGRPVLKSHLIGRGVSIWTRMIFRPLALTTYNRKWRTGWNERSRRHMGIHKLANNETVLNRIKDLFASNVRYNQGLASFALPERVDDYEIGTNIACGCHAAVYEARVRNFQFPRARTFDAECVNFSNASFGSDNNKQISKNAANPLSAYPLALKIMFNYDFNAPEHLLWLNMGTELIPIPRAQENLKGRMAKITFLPRSHPNVVKMFNAFTDRLPILEDARRLYPEALPSADFYELIVDEPRTLFIVMKRYRMTLREYVLISKRNYWCGRVLFGQLLEAIVFLYEYKISHRDMKSDNILLDFDTEDEIPHLALSDFGCALANDSWKIKYETNSVDLGGNLALRAPEVRCARPGHNTTVDFQMADLWASGTLGYEIFTRCNPFYSKMRSDTYTEDQLPPLPSRLHFAIKNLIKQMLFVDPKKRPDPRIAANVVSISLFRFGEDLKRFFNEYGFEMSLIGHKMDELIRASSDILRRLGMKMNSAVNDFTMLFAAETILARHIHPEVISAAELQLRATFLSRVNYEEIWATLQYFYIEDFES